MSVSGVIWEVVASRSGLGYAEVIGVLSMFWGVAFVLELREV